MKIRISEEGKVKFRLWLPTRLLFNRFFATLLPVFAGKELKKYKIRLTGSACRKFVREFYKCRKKFGGKLELVEVQSSSGDFVKIVL